MESRRLLYRRLNAHSHCVEMILYMYMTWWCRWGAAAAALVLPSSLNIWNAGESLSTTPFIYFICYTVNLLNNCELASKRCVVLNLHSSSKSKWRNEIIINDWMYRTQMGRSRVVDKSVSLQRQDDNTTENERRDELTWRRKKWRKSAHRSRASCSDSARVRHRTRAESDRKLHKWH